MPASALHDNGPVHYGILGTTQAGRADGTPVALGGARLRALLAALALRPGRALAPELLIGDIWGADPPADAAGALQALVGRLRRALGRAEIASVDGGYRLCAEPDAVDLHRFERLAAEGGRALADADPARAAALLDDALALWRGPVLADLPDAGVEVARAERRRLDAQCTRLAADLALGRAAQALPTLLALCADHPLDEPLQALRLHALRAAGRTAEALAAYEEIRIGLADRLGADPGPELRTLHAELLRPPPPHPPTNPPPPIPGAPAPAPTGPAPNGTSYGTTTSYGTGTATAYGIGTPYPGPNGTGSHHTGPHHAGNPDTATTDHPRTPTPTLTPAPATSGPGSPPSSGGTPIWRRFATAWPRTGW